MLMPSIFGENLFNDDWMDFAMHGMCVFSTGERAGYPMFYRNAEKKLAREQRK